MRLRTLSAIQQLTRICMLLAIGTFLAGIFFGANVVVFYIAFALLFWGIFSPLVLQIWLGFRGRNIAFPTSPEGVPVTPANFWIEADDELDVGTRVLAWWQGAWWRAVVVSKESNGRVLVHYVAWDELWDEYHEKTRLQHDPDHRDQSPDVDTREDDTSFRE